MADNVPVEDRTIRSKPLIELLQIAEVKGVLSGWSVTGPSIVLRRHDSHILVRAVDAAALVVRLIAEGPEK